MLYIFDVFAGTFPNAAGTFTRFEELPPQDKAKVFDVSKCVPPIGTVMINHYFSFLKFVFIKMLEAGISIPIKEYILQHFQTANPSISSDRFAPAQMFKVCLLYQGVFIFRSITLLLICFVTVPNFS